MPHPLLLIEGGSTVTGGLEVDGFRRRRYRIVLYELDELTVEEPALIWDVGAWDQGRWS